MTCMKDHNKKENLSVVLEVDMDSEIKEGQSTHNMGARSPETSQFINFILSVSWCQPCLPERTGRVQVKRS